MLARLGAPHDLAAVILAVEPPFTGPLIDSEGGAAGRMRQSESPCIDSWTIRLAA
jgi:hypothetical protein